MVFLMKWVVSLYKQRTSDWVWVSLLYTHSKDISPNAIAQQALNDCVYITYPLFDKYRTQKTYDSIFNLFILQYMTTKAYYHILISVILYETDVFVYYLYI